MVNVNVLLQTAGSAGNVVVVTLSPSPQSYDPRGKAGFPRLSADTSTTTKFLFSYMLCCYFTQDYFFISFSMDDFGKINWADVLLDTSVVLPY